MARYLYPSTHLAYACEINIFSTITFSNTVGTHCDRQLYSAKSSVFVKVKTYVRQALVSLGSRPPNTHAETDYLCFRCKELIITKV